MNETILVVDDEMDFLDSVKRGLISAGIRDIRAESDPRVAASSVQQGDRYAVALIDITMPWLNGVQLLEIIKGACPDTECIMVTAVNDARTAVECLQKGAYDYLTKPVSRDELVSKIRRARRKGAASWKSSPSARRAASPRSGTKTPSRPSSRGRTRCFAC